jgi:isopenicillin-N N-acyltransferase like protein
MILMKTQLLVMEGTPRQRGRIYGETMRNTIQEVIAKWKGVLAQSHPDPDQYIREFLAATNFKPAFERWTPGFLDQVQGLAEGSNLDFDTIYAFQLSDEEWVYSREPLLQRLQHHGHCSSLGVFGEGEVPIVAQNMDIPGLFNGYQMVLHEKDPNTGHEAFYFTFAGCLGVNGLNRYGVGVCENTVMQLQPCSDGLPVEGVLRGIVAQKTGREAEEFVRSVKHASGQNYLVGGTERVVSYECSANKVIPFTPLPTRTYHTNHPLVNDDSVLYTKAIESAPQDQKERAEIGRKNTTDRLSYLSRELQYTCPHITVEKIKSILSSHEAPVCVDYTSDDRSMTFGLEIMQLSQPPVFRVTFGPPCCNELLEFKF